MTRFSAPRRGFVSDYFVQQNAGKKNVCIDLNHPAGREAALKLVGEADVVVENFRPGPLKHFGLAYEQVAPVNRKVVYVSISGYGHVGPWRTRAAYAQTVQAETGLTASMWKHFGDALDLAKPMSDASSHADVYTGLEAAIGALAALHHARSTGEGQHVDVSMAATMLSVNERAHVDLAESDLDGEPAALGAAQAHVFRSAWGGHIVIATDRYVDDLSVYASAL